MLFVCILVQAHILQIYTFYIYRGMLAAIPLPFSYGMWKPTPFNVRFIKRNCPYETLSYLVLMEFLKI